MKKEIVVNKKKLTNNLKTFFISFLISIVILFLITILFGKFKIISAYGYSPVYKYENSLLEQGYYAGSRSYSDLSFGIKLTKYYLPFIFYKNIKLLLIMTGILFVILRLNKLFSIKIK
ncbi:MAG: hypothetical protein AB7D46_05375 [Flavobacteriaceae bacterium]